MSVALTGAVIVGLRYLGSHWNEVKKMVVDTAKDFAEGVDEAATNVAKFIEKNVKS